MLTFGSLEKLLIGHDSGVVYLAPRWHARAGHPRCLEFMHGTSRVSPPYTARSGCYYCNISSGTVWSTCSHVEPHPTQAASFRDLQPKRIDRNDKHSTAMGTHGALTAEKNHAAVDPHHPRIAAVPGLASATRTHGTVFSIVALPPLRTCSRADVAGRGRRPQPGVWRRTTSAPLCPGRGRLICFVRLGGQLPTQHCWMRK